MTKGAIGKVVQVQGAVVDVEFQPDEMPEIFHALEIGAERKYGGAGGPTARWAPLGALRGNGQH